MTMRIADAHDTIRGWSMAAHFALAIIVALVAQQLVDAVMGEVER